MAVEMEVLVVDSRSSNGGLRAGGTGSRGDSVG